ncbi:MAG: DUF4349 domain-containing protein [Fibrobacteria bacterium]|nr:DUF4349 domain-containing protein [Fibrobacteria bacterium]
MKSLRWLPLVAVALHAMEISPADTTLPPSPRVLEITQNIAAPDPEHSLRSVADLAESLGGWFQNWSNDVIEVRIPQDSLPLFEKGLERIGRRMDRRLTSRDITEPFLDQLGGIGSRIRLMDEWNHMLGTSKDLKSTLDLQAQIVQLAGQIDERRGVLLRLRHEVEYPKLVLRFRFEGRTASEKDGTSPFPWVNRLDLEKLHRSFR